MKRIYAPRTPPKGVLKASYGCLYGEEAIIYCYGGGGAQRCDGRILAHFFETAKCNGGKTLTEELTDRGYDMSTFKFSINHSSKT